jgi:hypothetical protein
MMHRDSNIKKSDIDYESRQCGLSNDIDIIRLGSALVLHNLVFSIEDNSQNMSNS